MDNRKITSAVGKLEKNLPLRHNQARLPADLRRFHQCILRHYLESGLAPGQGDIDFTGGWAHGIDRLAAQNIIVLDQAGNIAGAYPFTSEAREFRVVSKFGAVNAMCAFDALAVSSMFDIPTRIESRCRISSREIAIDQDGAESRVIEPEVTVLAAIDWHAGDNTRSCSTSLCTEMMFIAGETDAQTWFSQDAANRELFSLAEAHRFITMVFVPLMR